MDYNEILAQLITVELIFESQRKRSVGSNEQCVNVTILSDDIVEDDEVFYAVLSTDDPVVMLYPNVTEITIINNDCKSYHVCVTYFNLYKNTTDANVHVHVNA